MVDLFKKKIEYYNSGRREFFSIFPWHAKHVLDVGCGTGAFGKSLKEGGIEEVIGIEKNTEAAEIAKKNIDKVIIADIESFPLELNKNYFDVIILADVLEHLQDPWIILNKIKPLLKDDGFLFISIPNVRYYRVWLSLVVKGEFKYADSGILDIGHLRFFTFRTIKQYLKNANFKIIKIKRNFSGHISWFFNAILANIFADFFTRQYIFLARQERNDEINNFKKIS
ncbi:MAG: class I SAM-dependent methyltransferase [Candidatus Omnitrophica bacterium]|jgi:2-polyprenyl-3-methyl-5-hydroxy-6-metoxy-1,4-benzoquinol methylase|nr:class I SAM-dependent methyltransferase [Candidatus Omnitrophota bacterium]